MAVSQDELASIAAFGFETAAILWMEQVLNLPAIRAWNGMEDHKL